MARDIIVTWPKRRGYRSYLRELERARQLGLVINYRVSRPPKGPIDRCYVVHSGLVRGYSEVIEVVQRGEREVANVEGGFWPAGFYVVRKPEWHRLEARIGYPGFQGWRYFDRREAT